MVRFLAILSFCVSMYGVDIVSEYRTNGASKLVDLVEKELVNKDYWSNFLKGKDLSYGYFEADTKIIVVSKVAQQIQVYQYKNGGLKQSFEKEIITGLFGDKQKEGDLKTPVGAYELLKRFVPQDQFYGQISYATSYPNTYDRVQKKTGHGIWIHGHPLNNQPRYTKNTEGCIVMTNDNLDIFDNLIKDKKTLLLTYENEVKHTSKDELALILTQFFEWRHAWKYNDIQSYLNFYHEDFTRVNQSLRDFSNSKKALFAKKEQKVILVNDLVVTPYPNEQNRPLFRISYQQTYEAKSYKHSGKKELYIDFSNQKMKILAER